jgi:hypothetical protein
VRVARAIHQRIAGGNALAFLYVDMHAAGQGILALFAVLGRLMPLAAFGPMPLLSPPTYKTCGVLFVTRQHVQGWLHMNCNKNGLAERTDVRA